jgi:hypothetical protein
LHISFVECVRSSSMVMMWIGDLSIVTV